ncbi:MAG: riboflavin synthase [Bdellovibrionaceae bacterium]|nr:riboflavin synthase [Pseudobdellovibrionaceae bacterium]
MFSGIVEAVVPALSGEGQNGVFRLRLKRPPEFTDIRLGDSIAVDGVCLTVEAFDADSMSFALAAETLRVLDWRPETALARSFNLERSLRFGDRLHGHMVSGHVDSLGEVVRVRSEGESLFLDVRIQPHLRPLVWPKGSLAIHGVSLTVNAVEKDVVSVCLIPETQKRTNLPRLKVGDRVHIEPDFFARALARAIEAGALMIPQERR